MPEAQKVRIRLQQLSPDKYVKFRTAETEISHLLEYSQGGGHITFTPHGLSHVTAVELNYDWLLSDTDIEGMNASECFCLLMATIAHDVLMIPRRPGDEARARSNHAASPFEFLQQYGERLHISIHEAQAVAEIIRAHGVDDLSKIDDHVILMRERVCLRKLGACLSMADICNADETRAPSIVFKYLNLDAESAAHWRRHMQIGGITRSGHSIEVSALAFSEEGAEAVAEYVSAIRRQLEIVTPYFRSELDQISNVELFLKRLQSPLDQELMFRADPTSILQTLTSGVYERPDVFIRELIQNGLDAGYIREAMERKRGNSHNSLVVITQYWDSDGIRAIRVDDNGCGMDFVDIRDILLTIGSSISSRRSTQELLSGTTQKKLIATFGIGLLSCLQVAQEVRVTTSKGGTNQNIEVVIPGLSGRITARTVSEDSQGTTILVILKQGARQSLQSFYSSRSSRSSLRNLRRLLADRSEYEEEDEDDTITRSVRYYCRQVTQASLYLASTDWHPDLEQLPRSEQIAITANEENRIRPTQVRGNALTEFFGDTYAGWIWLTRFPQLGPDIRGDGSIEILSDGIFVTTEKSSTWLSDAFKHCSGRINFAAGALTLSVSRDKVVQDHKYRDIRKELAVKARAMVRTLSKMTSDPDKRNGPALALTAIFNLTFSEKNGIYAEMNDYSVLTTRGTIRRLMDIKQSNISSVFLAYSEGSTVKSLTEFDGKTLYHHEDDIVTLQSEILTDLGEVVLKLTRSSDSKGPIEAMLVAGYLKAAGLKVVDLTKERPVEGSVISEAIPKALQRRFGSKVKFVRVSGLSDRRAWTIGKETWLNLAHPEVAKCYEAVRSAEASQDVQFLAELLVGLLSCSFSEVLQDITFRLAGVRATGRNTDKPDASTP